VREEWEVSEGGMGSEYVDGGGGNTVIIM